MIDGKTVLGLIPARGGSKGLPGKNIVELCGKPLIAWSIETALQAGCIDELAVSTDSEEIAKIAEQSGAVVPFLRPAALATDTSPSIDVVTHALDYYRDRRSKNFDFVVLIEPTSPLREASDIDLALEEMLAAGADSVVSVCLAGNSHPAFMFRVGVDGRLEATQSGGFKTLRRQDLEPAFFPEGMVYASCVKKLREHQGFFQLNTIGYIVPKWKSPEIDDIVDFLHVEAIMKHRGIAT